MGGVACTVTAASATSITCDVGNGPVGDHKVIVNVNNKGDGDHGGSDVMFSYVAAITAINPTSGSLGGMISMNLFIFVAVFESIIVKGNIMDYIKVPIGAI